MSLKDGSKKMSKSELSDLSRINLTDDKDQYQRDPLQFLLCRLYSVQSFLQSTDQYVPPAPVHTLQKIRNLHPTEAHSPTLTMQSRPERIKRGMLLKLRLTRMISYQKPEVMQLKWFKRQKHTKQKL